MRKGFTLIELLVVIAIVAILSVVVILVINPAELLAQARDSNRINDLQNIKTALATFMADGQASTTLSMGNNANFYGSVAGITCNTRYATSTCVTQAANSGQKVDGVNGWIPVNLTAISSGSPLPAYPIDPVNTTSSGFFYTYRNGAGTLWNTFELTAVLESNKYKATGGPMYTDGGLNNSILEVGTYPGLNL